MNRSEPFSFTEGAQSDLPERLRRLRARRGLSQSQLAEALGVSLATINRWEQGHHRPTLALWRRILRVERREQEQPNGAPASLDVFAVPRPGPHPPAALPIVSTSFIGRERELAELRLLLSAPGGHLVTLAGAAGSGKSRLAIELAQSVVDDFAGAVRVVELASLMAPADLDAAGLRALDLREQPGVPLRDTLTAFLQARQFLLLLDNCEHLIDACRTLAEHLLGACPGLRILATSRRPLRTTTEVVRLLSPLRVPARGTSIDEVRESEAVQLFLDRAQALQPGFELGADTAGPVTQICRQLEGLPLALELAAARLHLLPVGRLAERLATSQRLLARPAEPEAMRHGSLRAALDWSYALLSPSEQALFVRLAAFAGGFSAEAAEVVCADRTRVPEADVLDLLERLIERSLLVEELRAGEPRLRLLEPVRQYALELLAEQAELETMQERHARWCVALAEEMALDFRGPREKAAMDRLEVEHDNLRAAMRWAETHGDLALRLGAALWWFWFQRSHFSEWQRYLEHVLPATAGLEVPARVAVLNGAAYLSWTQGDHARIEAVTSECLALARKLGDKSAEGNALHVLATSTWERGGLQQGVCLHNESLELFRQAGDEWGMAVSMGHLAIVHQLLGNFAATDAYHEGAVARFRAFGHQNFLGFALDVAGLSWEARGELQRAAGHYREALRLQTESDDRRGIAVGLTRLAATRALRGELEQAAALFAATDAMLRSWSFRMPQVYQGYADQHLAAVRAGLDAEGFARAWAEGQQMPLTDAIQLALTEELSPTSPLGGERLAEADAPPAGAASAGPDGLSPREVEVLALLAQGKSNKQIAQTLTLSVRTVERHIENGYRKTGVHGRAEAATYAIRHGFVQPL